MVQILADQTGDGPNLEHQKVLFTSPKKGSTSTDGPRRRCKEKRATPTDGPKQNEDAKPVGGRAAAVQPLYSRTYCKKHVKTT